MSRPKWDPTRKWRKKGTKGRREEEEERETERKGREKVSQISKERSLYFSLVKDKPWYYLWNPASLRTICAERNLEKLLVNQET